MITKIIHYCWFGGNPLPESAKKCIESWRKYCPDYEIKEWNESNFDINLCKYTREAYENKKWAFVSDYARFWILYNFGGLYFDTDVELIGSIDDIIDRGPFMGIECQTDFMNLESINNISVAAGLGLYAEPKLYLYKSIIDYYNQEHFVSDSGMMNLTSVVDRVSSLIEQFKIEERTTDYLKVAGVYIYNSDFFCPLNYFTGELVITKNTRSIHHYTESWVDAPLKHLNDAKRKLLEYGFWGRIISPFIVFPLKIRLVIYNIGIKGIFYKIFKIR